MVLCMGVPTRSEGQTNIGLRSPARRTSATVGARLESDFRSHYRRNAVSSGMDYEDYAPAYEFGFRLAKDPQFREREFDVG